MKAQEHQDIGRSAKDELFTCYWIIESRREYLLLETLCTHR